MKKSLLGILISAIAIALVFAMVDLSEVRVAFNRPVLGYLYPFVFTTLLIVLFFGYRWRLLVDRQIPMRSALVATIVNLGANMFLPARGGDILRLHYTRRESHIPVAVLFSRLFLEKIIDLVTVVFIGLLAVAWLNTKQIQNIGTGVVTTTALMVLLIAGFLLALRFKSELVIRCARPPFRLIHKEDWFDRHIAHLIRDIRSILVFNVLARQISLTVVMWLSIYSASYILIAGFVGLQLSYPEALFVLFAGALGLMLPAAPSGVGTFHGSVISAFLVLGRPMAEGLIFATAAHLLFFVSFAVPAGVLYGHWFFKRRSLR